MEPQAREVEFLNKGVDRPNRIALIDPVLQTLGKQRRLPAIDPLNEAPHLIPPQIAAESYSANQIIQCVFTQRGSFASRRYAPDALGMSAMPPLATRSVPRNEPSRCASSGREQMQKMQVHNSYLLNNLIGNRKQS